MKNGRETVREKAVRARRPMKRRMKVVRRDTIRVEGDLERTPVHRKTAAGTPAIREDRAEMTVSRKTAAGMAAFRWPEEGAVVGYQYHPPKKKLGEKLRELIKILRD